ncbi:MAG TPA: VIT domain-containing protein, partial [Longimicrobium sp.]|nr:VIT domain-containing protein [Longimicrobium sp.]
MKLLRTLTLALAVLGCTASGLHAQGVIVPHPCRDCPRPRPGDAAGLPVESVTFETTIEGQVATTHVTQVFRNPHGRVMEGTYFFPLPEEASITEF